MKSGGEAERMRSGKGPSFLKGVMLRDFLGSFDSVALLFVVAFYDIYHSKTGTNICCFTSTETDWPPCFLFLLQYFLFDLPDTDSYSEVMLAISELWL